MKVTGAIASSLEKAGHIKGTDKVIEALGYWPTFHDAEVISFSAKRALPFKSGFTIARLDVHVRHYEIVGEGTAQYAQVLRKNVLIRFVFDGACDIELSGFNHQNVINGIAVDLTEGTEATGFSVNIDSIFGFGGTLRCLSVSIESVELMSIALD